MNEAYHEALIPLLETLERLRQQSDNNRSEPYLKMNEKSDD